MGKLINIDREIYLVLPNEDLKKRYINDIVFMSDYNEEDHEYIAKGIYNIIKSNTEFNEKYGKIQANGRKQVDETCLVPGFSEPSGYYYSTGKTVICPFDWSWDENGDYDYSFSIAKII